MDGSAPWRQTSWDWRAAGNFALGGAGGALAFFAAGLTFEGGGHVWAAFLVAPLLIAAGLASIKAEVRAEIDPPQRVLLQFFKPQTSWLARQALIAPVLGLAALVAVVLPFGFVLLLLLLAAGGFLYAQARSLSDSDAATPWRDRRVVPFVLGTAAAEGTALLILVATLTFNDGAEAALRLAILLTALRWPIWTIYRDAVANDVPADGKADFQATFAGTRVAAVLWAPFALIALAVLVPSFGFPLRLLAGIGVLASGLWLKYLIFTEAAPKQSFASPGVPTHAAPAPAQPAEPVTSSPKAEEPPA